MEGWVGRAEGKYKYSREDKRLMGRGEDNRFMENGRDKGFMGRDMRFIGNGGIRDS